MRPLISLGFPDGSSEGFSAQRQVWLEFAATAAYPTIAAHPRSPKVTGGMGPAQIVQAFKETLIALAKSGAHEELAAAAKEARDAKGPLGD